MSSKSMKPSPAKQRELTNEERAAQVARFLSQKRESFALSAFSALCRREGMDKDPEEAAKWSVLAADALIAELYPIVKEGEKTE